MRGVYVSMSLRCVLSSWGGGGGCNQKCECVWTADTSNFFWDKPLHQERSSLSFSRSPSLFPSLSFFLVLFPSPSLSSTLSLTHTHTHTHTCTVTLVYTPFHTVTASLFSSRSPWIPPGRGQYVLLSSSLCSASAPRHSPGTSAAHLER